MLKWALGASGHVAKLTFLEVAAVQSSPTHGQDPLKWHAKCNQKPTSKPNQQLVMFVEYILYCFDVTYRNRAGSRNKQPGLPL